MDAFRAVSVLAPIDAKNIARDSMLRWMVLFPLLIAFVIRLAFPFLAERVQAIFNLDIEVYRPLLAGFLLITFPMLLGAVLGFLLLDQRDDRTLTALQVTPLALRGYLAYRITIPMLANILVTLAALPLSGLPEANLSLLALSALAAAPLTPIYALALVALAENKVQGFAVMKAAGVTLLPPLFAYLVQSDWTWLFGLAPTYWPARAFWSLSEGNLVRGTVELALGLAFQAVLVMLLLRLTIRRLNSGR